MEDGEEPSELQHKAVTEHLLTFCALGALLTSLYSQSWSGREWNWMQGPSWKALAMVQAWAKAVTVGMERKWHFEELWRRWFKKWYGEWGGESRKPPTFCLGPVGGAAIYWDRKAQQSGQFGRNNGDFSGIVALRAGLQGAAGDHRWGDKAVGG